jgi:peptide chain release factor subunit 3
LVISAKMGEFESGFEKGGQTMEHALLAKSIGIRHLIVLINKMDDFKWDRERYLRIILILKSFLLEIGYDVERHVSWVPIVGINKYIFRTLCRQYAASFKR